MPDQTSHRGEPLRGEIVSDVPHSTASTVSILDGISLLMDRLFTIPGTRMRFGLNSLLLLVPVLGDVIPTIVSVGIVMVGLSSYRVPRIVAARMLLNSLLDISLGWIPLIGDVFDLFFKADTRNVRLLQEYMGQGTRPSRSTWRHWAYVVALLLLFALVLCLMGLGVVALIQWLVQVIKER